MANLAIRLDGCANRLSDEIGGRVLWRNVHNVRDLTIGAVKPVRLGSMTRAVSIDPVYETPGAYYVNTQLGEDLVTNPDALSVPEALLLGPNGSATVVTRSNLAEPGELFMTETQIAALRSSLAVIHERFAALYGAEPGKPFAMEIEFKITASGQLSIKQARTWVFN